MRTGGGYTRIKPPRVYILHTLFNFTTSRFNSDDGFSTITRPYLLPPPLPPSSRCCTFCVLRSPRSPLLSLSLSLFLSLCLSRELSLSLLFLFPLCSRFLSSHLQRRRTTLWTKTNWKYLLAKYSRGTAVFDSAGYVLGRQRRIRSYRLVIKYPFLRVCASYAEYGIRSFSWRLYLAVMRAGKLRPSHYDHSRSARRSSFSGIELSRDCRDFDTAGDVNCRDLRIAQPSIISSSVHVSVKFTMPLTCHHRREIVSDISQSPIIR